MNFDIKTIRRTYQIGIFVGVGIFALMILDYVNNQSQFMVPFAILFGVVALFLGLTLFAKTGEKVIEKDLPWDYPGDIHEVVDLEGIGPTYAQRLHAAGIYHTQELLFADDDFIATTAKVQPKVVQNWKSMAQLIKVKGIGPQYAEALVRGGVTNGIESLKTCNVQETTDAVNAYLEGLDVTVVGHLISDKRMTKWVNTAKKMEQAPIDLDTIKVKTLGSKAAKAGSTAPAKDGPGVRSNL